MPVTTSARQRIDPFVAAMQPTTRLVNWRPTAWSMAIATSLLVTSRPNALDLRLAIGGALVASSIGFLIDDTAAATLAPAPATLRTRRVQRLVLAAVPAATFWAFGAMFVASRIGGVPLTSRTLLFTTLATVALVAAAIAARHGDRTSGGIAGAVTALVVFALTFLPHRAWLPIPPGPDAPHAASKLTFLLAAALAALWWECRDPAARRARSTS